MLRAEGDPMIYQYDFGDNWQHELVLEKVLPADAAPHPLCASAGSGVVHQKMSVVSVVIRGFWKSSSVRRMKNTGTTWDGRVVTSWTSSTSRPSTKSCQDAVAGETSAVKWYEHDSVGRHDVPGTAWVGRDSSAV